MAAHTMVRFRVVTKPGWVMHQLHFQLLLSSAAILARLSPVPTLSPGGRVGRAGGWEGTAGDTPQPQHHWKGLGLSCQGSCCSRTGCWDGVGDSPYVTEVFPQPIKMPLYQPRSFLAFALPVVSTSQSPFILRDLSAEVPKPLDI